MFCQFFPFLFNSRISLRNQWAQPELSHSQDDVQSERKAGQGESIRL
jgi:hypothetical protein